MIAYPFSLKRLLWLTPFVAGLFFSLAANDSAMAQAIDAEISREITLSLEEAVAQGKVDVQISGRGVSTGDSMYLQLHRKTPEAIRIEITPGTLLVSKTGRAQRMAVQQVKFEYEGRRRVPTTQIVLGDDRWRSYLVEAYCCDFHLPAPRVADRFTVQILEPKAQAILTRALQVGAGKKVIQAALWMDLNGVKGDSIRRSFKISDAELRAAAELLKTRDDVPADLAKLADVIGKLGAGVAAGMGKAEILADGVELRLPVPVLKKVIGELRRGDQVTVVANLGKDLAVLAQIDGVQRRGLIPADQARILGEPAIGGGDLAQAIEAFTRRGEPSSPPAGNAAQPRQY